MHSRLVDIGATEEDLRETALSLHKMRFNLSEWKNDNEIKDFNSDVSIKIHDEQIKEE